MVPKIQKKLFLKGLAFVVFITSTLSITVMPQAAEYDINNGNIVAVEDLVGNEEEAVSDIIDDSIVMPDDSVVNVNEEEPASDISNSSFVMPIASVAVADPIVIDITLGSVTMSDDTSTNSIKLNYTDETGPVEIYPTPQNGILNITLKGNSETTENTFYAGVFNNTEVTTFNITLDNWIFEKSDIYLEGAFSFYSKNQDVNLTLVGENSILGDIYSSIEVNINKSKSEINTFTVNGSGLLNFEHADFSGNFILNSGTINLQSMFAWDDFTINGGTINIVGENNYYASLMIRYKFIMNDGTLNINNVSTAIECFTFHISGGTIDMNNVFAGIFVAASMYDPFQDHLSEISGGNINITFPDLDQYMLNEYFDPKSIKAIDTSNSVNISGGNLTLPSLGFYENVIDAYNGTAFTFTGGTTVITGSDIINQETFFMDYPDPDCIEEYPTPKLYINGGSVSVPEDLLDTITWQPINAMGEEVEMRPGKINSPNSLFTTPSDLQYPDGTTYYVDGASTLYGVNDMRSDSSRKIYPWAPQNVNLVTYTKALTVTTDGNGTATGSGSYANGDSVSISASPNDGYIFVNWTVSGDGSVANADSASTSFTMGANTSTVTANFKYAPVVTPTDTPSPSNSPEVSETTEVTETSEVTPTPVVTDTTDVTETSEVTPTPVVTDTTESTSIIEATATPVVTNAPVETAEILPVVTPNPDQALQLATDPVTLTQNGNTYKVAPTVQDPNLYIVFDAEDTPLGTIYMADGVSFDDIILDDEIVPLGDIQINMDIAPASTKKKNPVTSDSSSFLVGPVSILSILFVMFVVGKRKVTSN